MTSMSSPDAKCYSDSPSFVRNPVSRWTADRPCKWIISTRRCVSPLYTSVLYISRRYLSARRIPDNTFEGCIMTNDTKMNYWGYSGDEIKLQESAFVWKFEPMLP